MSEALHKRRNKTGMLMHRSALDWGVSESEDRLEHRERSESALFLITNRTEILMSTSEGIG